eukprot:4593218-Amphidinium_carterae.1
MGVNVSFTTRDLGVDVQWGPWRNPVQQARVQSFGQAMKRVRMLNLPLRFKMSMIRALYPLVIYGSEVSGFAETSLGKVRIAARGALGRGTQLRRAAELELTLKGGIKADPQVAFDLHTIRAWQRACGNMHVWPPPEAIWDKVDRGRKGRGPFRHLKTLCFRLGWTPQPQGFLTPGGSIAWEDADYYVVTASHRYVMARRPEFEGIEFGIDGRTIKAMRTLANRNDHPSRAVLNAACGGLWMGDRREKVFEQSAKCP